MSSSDVPPLYHALPQADTPVNASRLELVDESGMLPDLLQPVQAPALVDSKVHWTYFILGCSVLLPWNVVITAMPFFLSRLATSPLRSTFASYLTTSFTASNFIFLAHATSISKNMTPSTTTHSCIIWLIILNTFLTLSTFFTPSPGVFFAFILFNGAAQATVGAYLQTSVIAVASLFGPGAVQAMMAGQAAVAVAVSGVQVVSAAISVWGRPRTFVSDGSAEERSAFIFFALSTVFLAFSALAHSWLVKSPAYQQVAKHLETNARTSGITSDHERRGLISRGPSNTANESGSRKNALRIAKVNSVYHVAVAYVFLATLAVFPPITTSVQPTNPDTHPLLFSAVHFLVFNVGDFLGRYVCSFPVLLIWSAKRLLTLSLARTLFIPLFLMCNIQGGPSFSSQPPVINSDSVFMFLLFAFGWSNGYVSSLCMMSAPSVEHNPRLKGRAEDVDVAATVASFCLVGGLALGSMASFAVKATICKCNPFTA